LGRWGGGGKEGIGEENMSIRQTEVLRLAHALLDGKERPPWRIMRKGGSVLHIPPSPTPSLSPSLPPSSFLKRFFLTALLRNVPKKRLADVQEGEYVKVVGEITTVHPHEAGAGAAGEAATAKTVPVSATTQVGREGKRETFHPFPHLSDPQERGREGEGGREGGREGRDGGMKAS